MPVDILLFLTLVSIALVVPGPDFVVVSRNTFVRGRTGGYLTVVGICVGLALLTLFTAFGIATFVAQSPILLFGLRVAGGTYLALLGGVLVWNAGAGAGSTHATGQRRTAGRGVLMAQGFLTNVLNPKALVFYLAVIPQFLNPSQSATTQSIVLGTLVVCCAALWWGIFVTAIAPMSAWFNRPRVRAGVDRGAGCALIVLGAWMVLAGV